ncbi:MAG: hypothetical protein WCI12_07750 [Actinomycetes bacterium]
MVRPGTLFEATVLEVRRIARRPFEVLVCVAANGVLVTILWFFAPLKLANLVFSVHTALFFPIVLASWMLADVPATNQLAPDRVRVLAALGDPEALRLLLRAKHVVLWLLVSPVTVVVIALQGARVGDPVGLVLTVIWVLTVPFCALGVACLVGVRWPYHPMRLKDRWSRRSDWRPMILRWGILILIPYALVPAIGVLDFVPSYVVWKLLGYSTATGEVSKAAFALGLGLTIPLAGAVWHFGTKAAVSLAHRRSSELREFLADPSRG